MKKLFTFSLLLVLLLTLTACGSSNGDDKKIRIGYQKNGTTLLLKGTGDLEKELKELGYKVEWSEFNTASSILEALNSGAIDLANAGDAPSVMAVSKGMNFKYIAAERSASQTEGILVKKDGNITKIEDLKGKRVAYNKASIAEYLLAVALETVNLTLADVESVILSPADASVAFEKGEVDAWVTWDPFMTVSEAKGNTILTTAEGLLNYRSYYFASEELVDNYPDVVKAYVENIIKIGTAIDKDSTKAAEILEENTGIESSVWVSSYERKTSIPEYINDDVLNDLKTLNDGLYAIDLIEKPVEDFTQSIWQP